MKRSEAARAKWARVIEAQARSGLSAAAFCAERGIWSSSFFAWKRKLGIGGARPSASPALMEARVHGLGVGPRGDGDDTPAFVEARVRRVDEAPGGGVAVELALGRRLLVGRGFDRQLLLDVIDTLESRGAGDRGGAGR